MADLAVGNTQMEKANLCKPKYGKKGSILLINAGGIIQGQVCHRCNRPMELHYTYSGQNTQPSTLCNPCYSSRLALLSEYIEAELARRGYSKPDDFIPGDVIDQVIQDVI